mgnify:CR=1 FL=1
MIRDETAADGRAIFEVTRAAFENHPISRQTEPYIVEALRAAGALVVSLVAEADGRVVGHVAFSPVSLSDGSQGWYGVGPLSVLPECQRRGIGTALMHEGVPQENVLTLPLGRTRARGVVTFHPAFMAAGDQAPP